MPERAGPLVPPALHPPRQQTLHGDCRHFTPGFCFKQPALELHIQHTRCFCSEMHSAHEQGTAAFGYAWAMQEHTTATRDLVFNKQSLFCKMAVVEQCAEAQGLDPRAPTLLLQGQGLGAAGHGSRGAAGAAAGMVRARHGQGTVVFKKYKSS